MSDGFFKWLLLICDDEPEKLGSIIDGCTNAGLEVVELSKPVNFPANFTRLVPTIQSANLALIDMQWDIGLEGDKFPSVPWRSSLPPSEFCQRWMDAIQAWATSVEKPAPTEAWPRARIHGEDVGAWIGAMLSWLAPQCQIVFFSSHESIFNEKLPAALRLFRRPFFIVHPKRKQEGATGIESSIAVEELWPYLPGLQRSLLRNPAVRVWFLRDVILRLLANCEPEIRDADILFPGGGSDGAGGFESRKLHFDYVFPNLVAFGREERLRQMRDLIEPPRLRRNDLVALHQGEHALKQGRNEEAQHFLCQAGPWGLGSAARLEESRIRNEIDHSNTAALIDEAREMIQWSLQDARPFLRRMAERHSGAHELLGGSALIVGDRELTSTFSGGANKGLVIHRFPPHWIDDAIFAIRDNACKQSCAFSFTIIENNASLVVKVASEWRGTLTPESFWKTEVINSLARGIYRGYPQFFCSALESGADACWLKTGSDWQCLWGEDLASPNGQSEINPLCVILVFLKEKTT